MLRRWLGQRGERLAERHLRRHGLRTVARNWRCRFGEIDLVMADDETLVFIEVRVRHERGYGSAADSVTATKQARVARAASMFIAERPDWQQRACRFDVVVIEAGDRRDDLRWITGAFGGSG